MYYVDLRQFYLIVLVCGFFSRLWYLPKVFQELYSGFFDVDSSQGLVVKELLCLFISKRTFLVAKNGKE